jgi:hypothetical protein
MPSELKTSNLPRATTRINSRLERQLTAYITAAGAGVLAAAQPAQAKVVYTALNMTIGENSQYLLDLNHDGVNDFTFTHFAYGHFDHFYVLGSPANQIFGNGSASALHFGAPIGPKGVFSGFGLIEKWGFNSNSSYSTGNWANVQNRYLGFQFSINGKTHYGWARLTVTVNHGIIGTLTGYAYETIPNKRILAGQTSGTDSAAGVAANTHSAVNVRPATLGMLARGADTLAIWRREEVQIS